MLLIREIDLSVGSMAGLAGATLAVLSVNLRLEPVSGDRRHGPARPGDRLHPGAHPHVLQCPLVPGHARRLPHPLRLAVARPRLHRLRPVSVRRDRLGHPDQHAAAGGGLCPRGGGPCLLPRRRAARTAPPPARPPADRGLARDRAPLRRHRRHRPARRVGAQHGRRRARRAAHLPRPDRGVLDRHPPHHLRPPHLRHRRQSRRCAPRWHQCQRRAAVGLLAVRGPCRIRRRHGRLVHRRRQHPARRLDACCSMPSPRR